jgi:thiamine pyrophosphokinase
MSKSIIFTGSNPPLSLPQGLIQDGDVVIAADSGYDAARCLGVPVDLAVGDFDSTEFAGEIEAIRHERHRRDKDESDTFLAISRGMAMAGPDYALVGGGGGRVDHLLALYSLFDRFGPPVSWHTAYEDSYLVRGHRVFEGIEAGATVSFFPARLTGSAIVDAVPLRWPLCEYPLSFSTISLSNRTMGDTLEVRADGVELFVCFPVAGAGTKMLP